MVYVSFQVEVLSQRFSSFHSIQLRDGRRMEIEIEIETERSTYNLSRFILNSKKTRYSGIKLHIVVPFQEVKLT